MSNVVQLFSQKNLKLPLGVYIYIYIEDMLMNQLNFDLIMLINQILTW